MVTVLCSKRGRDLKAENVMLHASGDWLLCDFGSATNSTLASPSPDAMGMAEVRQVAFWLQNSL